MPKKSTDDKRSFTVVGSSIGVEHGRYLSKTPYAAAKKAATQQFKKAKPGVTKVKILLKETTVGSSQKTYFYWATRVKLAVPTERVVKFNGKETIIRNEYNTTLKKYNSGAHLSDAASSSSS